MLENIFEELNNKLSESDLIGSSRHAAAIVHNGKILSIGHNRRKTHPLMLKFQHKPYKIFLHAEIDAIVKIKDKTLLKECQLYVARRSKGNNILNSEPCETCKKAIRFFGIKQVYWTENP
jgi:tRNA(Arg) A34 adenosine deaminase TadA